MNLERSHFYAKAENSKMISQSYFETHNGKKYLVLLEHSHHNGALLIDSQGDLYTMVNVGLHKIEDESSYMYLMHILENPIHDIIDKLISRFNVILDKKRTNDIFPFYQLVFYVFNNPSSVYWFELAYSWFESFDDLNKIRMLPILEKKITSIKSPQKLRHKIIKDIKVIKINSNSFGDLNSDN